MIRPRISIGLPVYNGAPTLGRQLDSILGQTFTNFELSVFDNCSTDSTGEICRAYLGDSRLRYHRHPENMGLDFNYKACFYTGLEREFFIYASANDYWAPNYLEECLKALDGNPEAVLAYSYCWLIQGENRRLYRDDFNLPALGPEERLMTVIRSMDLCTAFYGLIRTGSLAANNRYLALPSAGNDNLLLWALAADGPFIEVPEPLFNRERPAHENMSLAERRVHLEKINNQRTYRPAFPFLNHLLSSLSLLDKQYFNQATRNRLFPEVVNVLLSRSGHHMETEIKIAVDHLLAGRLHTGFSGETAWQSGCYPYIDHFTVTLVLTSLENAMFFLVPVPKGLHLGRAVCYLQLGRPAEAVSALEAELAVPAGVFDYDAKARELLAKLRPRVAGGGQP